MKPIKFDGHNAIYAENQPEYLPLPVHKAKDGLLTTYWKLSIWERIQVLFGRKLCLKILTFNHPLQPIKLTIEREPIP